MSAPAIFDRQLARRRRARAAKTFSEADFLWREITARLSERLDDLTQQFPKALALGSRDGLARNALKGKGGIEWLVESDLAAETLVNQGARLVLDPEALPFGGGVLDLVFGAGDLHLINDLPGALIQIRQALRPDGLFLGALLGPGTLTPLTQAFLKAEVELNVPVSPHVSPFVDIRDAAALLQRAGFALPVADSEKIVVSYADPLRLLQDLRMMGEASVLQERSRHPLRRRVLMNAMEKLAETVGPDGRVAIPFEVIFLAGWCPAASQQQPAQRGSGTISLASALKRGQRSS